MAQYTILNFHWTPDVFVNLPINRKGFVCACIENQIEHDKKEAQRMKRK